MGGPHRTIFSPPSPQSRQSRECSIFSPPTPQSRQSRDVFPPSHGAGCVWVAKWSATKQKHYYYDKLGRSRMGRSRSPTAHSPSIRSPTVAGSARERAAERVRAVRQKGAPPAAWIGKWSGSKQHYYYYDKARASEPPVWELPPGAT
eukprot:gene44528-26670_t